MMYFLILDIIGTRRTWRTIKSEIDKESETGLATEMDTAIENDMDWTRTIQTRQRR